MAIVNDETSRILAEWSPVKWRQYALQEAKREWRGAQDAAYATYQRAGGDLGALRRALGQHGDSVYAALVAAKLEYDQTCGAIQGEYARVTA